MEPEANENECAPVPSTDSNVALADNQVENQQQQTEFLARSEPENVQQEANTEMVQPANEQEEA